MIQTLEPVDVVIVGGGPVGLAIAYQLRRFGDVSVHIVEKHPKPAQENFGRAVTFWSRSMEMLDQIGLAPEILQQCFSVRTSAAYDKDGKEVFGRGWSFLEGITDTKYTFASVLRQKYVEEIFRGALEKHGVSVQAPADFQSLEVDESVPLGGHRVTATILDAAKGAEYKIKCKYLIGADGSRTQVRRAADIESDGSRTEDQWVRIDGVLTTDMPKPRSYGALESPTYGNVLWIPLDHGATRIGFALNEERRKLYGGFSQEMAIAEAKLCVKPFNIDYQRVDWASVYIVGQRVARKFFTKGCIFLAGDACHTHSSGAGQGMNAGMHDAVNLGWKLSLVLNGMAKHELLQTYDDERRPNAEKLIKYDEDISMLVTGKLPPSWKGDPAMSPNVVLGEILQEAKGFNTGLTIGYRPNALNVEDAKEKVPTGESVLTNISIPTRAIPGFRAPDVQLILPAILEPTRLHTVTPNYARFYIAVFAGESAQTKQSLSSLKMALALSPLFSTSEPSSGTTNGATNGTPNGAAGDIPNGANSTLEHVLSNVHMKGPGSTKRLPVDFLTIFAQESASTWDLLGQVPFGKAYYDPEGKAHQRYDVDVSQAVVTVIRPDGWMGMRIAVTEGQEVVEKLEKYFESFMNL